MRVCDDGYLLVCTKSYESGRIHHALEVACIALACIRDLVKQISMHWIPAAKEMGRICGYLGEVISHEKIVSKSAAPGDAQLPLG
jgi:hypothetical protein